MTWLLYGITAYLTYYTIMFARAVWKNGNKIGAVAVGVLAGVFLPIALVIDYMR